MPKSTVTIPSITPDKLRAAVVFRIKTEKEKGTHIDHRNFQPYEGAPIGTIPEFCDALSEDFDILICHDQLDGCLLVELGKRKVSELKCLQHPR